MTQPRTGKGAAGTAALDGPRHSLERLLEELGRAPLTDLPMCIVIVDAGGRFWYANAATRRLLGLPAEGAVDASMPDFHAQAGRHEELVAAAHDHHGVAPKVLVELRVAGEPVFVEHYLSPIPFEESERNGLYVGMMVDVTEDHQAAQRTAALQNTVREMTFDIGQILHANTATLVMVNQTLMAAARALEPELWGNEEASRPEAIEARIAQLAATLSASLSRLLEAGDPARRAAALPPERWEKLASLVSSLDHYEENIAVPELRISALRVITGEVLSACREIPPKHLPKEALRDTIRAASDLERATCYSDILASRTAVIQMDTSLAALRDFITTEIRTDDPRARASISGILREAIGHLAEFSNAARVDVVWRNRPEDVMVYGNRRDLLRALTNVLHNAIKYSWKREGDERPWINVDVHERDADVRIEIENWGVPVEKVEIEAGLIFGMGYRGKRSKDRGRLGTGIGLTDSLRVAEAHQGSLVVQSRPARSSSLDPDDRDYYKQPFLTRVTMTLPTVG